MCPRLGLVRKAIYVTYVLKSDCSSLTPHPPPPTPFLTRPIFGATRPLFRGRFTDCKFEYNMSHLVPQLMKLLHGKLFWVGCVVVLCIIVAALIILPEFLV